eukprot:PhF_6_TR13019/c0_g1_i2/m.20633/K08339/ATG5; autophagy-related protein 5
MSIDTDDAFVTELCKGCVVIRFRLSTKDTTVPNPPEVILSLPRNSYLPLHMATVHETFEPHTTTIPGAPKTLWLDLEGSPVPWHVPVGVLFDRYVSLRRNNISLPLRFCVNYSNFPKDKLLPCWEANFEAQFRHTIKGAVCCMYDSAKAFMSNPSPTLFTETDAMLRGAAGDGGREAVAMLNVHKAIKSYGGPPQRYPITLHLINASQDVSVVTSSLPASALTSKPEGITLGDGVAMLLKDATWPEEVVIHGLVMDPATPMTFVLNNLVSADLVVHMVVRRK